MARDRSPLTQRLKSLAQRAGRPDEPDPAPPTPASPQPADEQPTGEVPAIAEQPTDDQPAVELPPAPIAPIEPPNEQPTLITSPIPAPEPSGPTLAPPVLPPREAPEPQSDTDEPFSGATVWPQTSPTPRFEPEARSGPPTHPVDPPTFPEPSPEPDADDLAAAGPGEAPTTNAAALVVEEPADADPAELTPQAPKRAGLLSRLRPGRDADASWGAGATPAERQAPLVASPVAAAPEPAVLPPSPEPPAKPSFAERAALRRRAKSLRARRDAGLLELGAIVLDQRRFGDPTGGSLMRRRTDELADIDSELAAIEQVLDDDGPAETVAQLGVVRCLTCTSLVGPGDRFCVQCGAPRPEGTAPAARS